MKRNCASCGKEFTAYAGAKKGHEVFCSHDCYAKEAVHLNAQHTKHFRGHGGKRADLGDCYFRSKWEANWARYLDWMKKRGEILDWQYEVDTFQFTGIKRGSRFYTPDFKVFENNGKIIYHEIKGWMDAKSSTKLARMKKYHPSIEILLVQQQEYEAVKKDLRSIIPGWE